MWTLGPIAPPGIGTPRHELQEPAHHVDVELRCVNDLVVERQPHQRDRDLMVHARIDDGLPGLREVPDVVHVIEVAVPGGTVPPHQDGLQREPIESLGRQGDPRHRPRQDLQVGVRSDRGAWHPGTRTAPRRRRVRRLEAPPPPNSKCRTPARWAANSRAGSTSRRRTLPPKERCRPSRNGVSITRIFLGAAATLTDPPRCASRDSRRGQQYPKSRSRGNAAYRAVRSPVLTCVGWRAAGLKPCATYPHKR